MDVCSVIHHRLEELGLEQKDLAAAANVTESYISQLLTRKKLPPAPDRTDLYGRMERLLKLPKGKLSDLALSQRRDELKRQWDARPAAPLLQDLRELLLRKCPPAKEKELRSIFEREPFGELERLVTQKLLDLAKKVAREVESESWLRLAARSSGLSYKQLRVIVLEFLDTDLFNVSANDCVSFLDPLIESWDIDVGTFAMEVVLNRKLVPDSVKRFEFVEKEGERDGEQAGFQEFLRDRSLSGSATPDEIEFLRRLRFTQRQPTALFYYRELQNLRDPLHFR